MRGAEIDVAVSPRRARLSDPRLAALLVRACEGAACGLVVRDVHRRIVFANSAAERILGMSAETLAGAGQRRELPSVVSVDGVPRAEALAPLQRILTAGLSSTEAELVFEHVDGQRLTARVSVAPLYDTQNTLVGAVTSLTDVTAPAETDATVRHTRREPQQRAGNRTEEPAAREQHFAGLIETMADGMLVFDAEGRFVQANAAAERLPGLKRGAILGLPFQVPPWRRLTLDGAPFPDEEYPFVRVKRSGAPVHNVEFLVEREDGSSAFSRSTPRRC